MKKGVPIDVDCQVCEHDLEKVQQCSFCGMAGCLACYQPCTTCPRIVCPWCLLKSHCQGTACDGRCKQCIGPVKEYWVCLASGRRYTTTGCVSCVDAWGRDTESYLHCQRICEQCELNKPRFCSVQTCTEAFCPHEDEDRLFCDYHYEKK